MCWFILDEIYFIWWNSLSNCWVNLHTFPIEKRLIFFMIVLSEKFKYLDKRTIYFQTACVKIITTLPSKTYLELSLIWQRGLSNSSRYSAGLAHILKKKDLFRLPFIGIFSDQKSESSYIVHLVENLILYKTLYRAIFGNEFFLQDFSLQR